MPLNSTDFNSRSAVPNSPRGRRHRTTNEPYYDSVSLAKQLRRYDRQPFLDLLKTWFESGPTPEEMAAFAAKYPDRWIQGMRAIASMAGFAERTEVDHTLNINVRMMSDSQLEDALRKELDGTASEVTPEGEAAAKQPESADGSLSDTLRLEGAKLGTNGS